MPRTSENDKGVICPVNQAQFVHSHTVLRGGVISQNNYNHLCGFTLGVITWGSTVSIKMPHFSGLLNGYCSCYVTLRLGVVVIIIVCSVLLFPFIMLHGYDEFTFLFSP